MNEPDHLADLRDQIRAATAAAERLVRDVGDVGDVREVREVPDVRDDSPPPPGETPPAGWQQSDDGGAPSELVALARLLEALREILPAELQQQVTDLIRQLLVVLRALIDWAVGRLEQESRGRDIEVEDIRID